MRSRTSGQKGAVCVDCEQSTRYDMGGGGAPRPVCDMGGGALLHILNLPLEVLKAFNDTKQACHEATEIEHYTEAFNVYENYIHENSL